MGRKYAIKVILVKSYKKILLFFLTKTLKDIRNYSLKLAKVLSQQFFYLKPMSHFMLMLPSILESSKLVGNTPPPPSPAPTIREHRQKSFVRLSRFWLLRESGVSRDGSRVAATSKMECFVIIVNGWKPYNTE